MPTKKLTGDLAQTSVGGAVLNFTGNTTSASLVITSPSSTLGLSATPQLITGAGIPALATVSLIAGVVTLSAAATVTAAGVALTVSTAEVQVIGLMDWNISFKLKTADATTTDDAEWESSLPSSGSWSVKAKYVYLMGDPSQIAQIRATLASTTRVPQRWNFFAAPNTGDDSFTGMAYIDGIDWTAGVGKIVGQDVSLKGTGPLAVVAQLAPVPNAATITNLQAED
jgi:hypothetical protein